ncbi:N/A [soil metagenome]
MTRVCFVIDTLSRAGTETQLLALIRNLDRSRVEPSLVLLDGSDVLSQSLEPADCPTLRLGVTKLASLQAMRAARQLHRFWEQHRPDVVQAYFMDSAYFAIPVAKFCGIRKIVRVRNNLGYWLTRKHRVLNRVMRRFVSVTLTNSEQGREQLVRERVGSVHVIENGVDTFHLNTLRSEDSASRLTVMCVANLRPVKNIDGLLRAAANIVQQRPEVHFEIAGDGPERGHLESLRDSLGLQQHVTFRGSVSDIPAFLTTGSVAVLPSHSEGMSNALLEMMAAGLGVVATDVGANARVLADTGVIVPPGNDVALVAGILSLLDQPERAVQLGVSARQRVEAHFSRHAMCRQFEDFYLSLVAGVRQHALVAD